MEFFQVPNKLKVLFLGSGPIAAPVLEALHKAEDIDLCAAVTQPDRPCGRKRVLTPTPLGQAAINLGLEPLRVPDVNSGEFLEIAESFAPDMLCVVSFGQILKTPLLMLPPFGCINVHASLLPAYRGASPIVQALLNGDTSTGVAFMLMEKGLDSGPVFRMLEYKLDGTEYADSLEMELGRLAGEKLPETLHMIASGELVGTAQDLSKVSVCRKISKRDGYISWNSRSAEEIERMSRAYFPWPGALCDVEIPGGKRTVINICKAAAVSGFDSLAPGECADLNGRIVVGCSGGSALEILELIPSGTKRMNAASFRNGLRGALPVFPEELQI